MDIQPQPTPYVEYDHVRGKHICRLGGEGNPIIETDTLTAMIEFLECMHVCVRAKRPGILDVIFRRKGYQDAMSKQKAPGINLD